MEQKVLITAGATGIGRAMADSFSSQGSEVWVADVDEVALDTCPKEWRRDQLDVTDEKAISKLFSQLHAEWGELNVLCANAGIAGPTAPVEETSLAEWRRCVSVNLEGAFLFAKYAAPVMKSQKSGVIILTSSTAGLYGFMHRAPYVSAKWGVIGLMKTLAIELGPFNIRANAICPGGGVEGDRLDRVIEREAAAKGVPRRGDSRSLRRGHIHAPPRLFNRHRQHGGVSGQRRGSTRQWASDRCRWPYRAPRT